MRWSAAKRRPTEPVAIEASMLAVGNCCANTARHHSVVLPGHTSGATKTRTQPFPTGKNGTVTVRPLGKARSGWIFVAWPSLAPPPKSAGSGPSGGAEGDDGRRRPGRRRRAPSGRPGAMSRAVAARCPHHHHGQDRGGEHELPRLAQHVSARSSSPSVRRPSPPNSGQRPFHPAWYPARKTFILSARTDD